ncbi:unnamed protein product [Lasius platythorax]|uniref:Uncharacterized protein n=1 Tax=Lasius platythorax TaxID=488582 RepID=A0AAV2N8T8_9HYME
MSENGDVSHLIGAEGFLLTDEIVGIAPIGLSLSTIHTYVIKTIVQHGLHTLLLTLVSSRETSCPDKDPSSLWHARRDKATFHRHGLWSLVRRSFLRTRLNEA